MVEYDAQEASFVLPLEPDSVDLQSGGVSDESVCEDDGDCLVLRQLEPSSSAPLSHFCKVRLHLSDNCFEVTSGFSRGLCSRQR